LTVIVPQTNKIRGSADGQSGGWSVGKMLCLKCLPHLKETFYTGSPRNVNMHD